MKHLKVIENLHKTKVIEKQLEVVIERKETQKQLELLTELLNEQKTDSRIRDVEKMLEDLQKAVHSKSRVSIEHQSLPET